MITTIEITEQVGTYKQAAALMRQLCKMDPADVVYCTTFPVRVSWVIPRMVPTLEKLEEEMSAKAVRMIFEGKTVREICLETSLPYRKVSNISKRVRKSRWNDLSIRPKRKNPLDLWINILLRNHVQKLSSAVLPPILTIS